MSGTTIWNYLLCKKYRIHNVWIFNEIIRIVKFSSWPSLFYPFEKKSIDNCRIDSTVELNSSGSDGNKSEIAVSLLDLKGNLCLGGTSSSPLSFVVVPILDWFFGRNNGRCGALLLMHFFQLCQKSSSVELSVSYINFPKLTQSEFCPF